MILTKEKIKHFKNYGMVKIENFMNKNEAKAFLREVERLSKSKNTNIAKYYQENLLGTKNELFRIEYFYNFSKKFKI